MPKIEIDKEIYEYLEKIAAEEKLSATEYLNREMRSFFITSAEAQAGKEAAALAAKEVRAIARNPERIPGKVTELEREVPRIHQKKEKQTVEIFTTKVKQYWAPFNYPNFVVELGRPGSGAEFNTDGIELDLPPHGAITFTEKEPIIGVTVIGSSCVPPGTVILHAEPIERKFPRSGVKMKVEHLWGSHLLYGPWSRGTDEGFREAGMNSAHFDLPESRKVTIMGHCSMDVDINPPGKPEPPERAPVAHGVFWNDPHYTVRAIRVIVKVPEKMP